MTLTVLLRIRHARHLRPPNFGHIFPICTHILWSTSGAPVEFSPRTSMPYRLLEASGIPLVGDVFDMGDMFYLLP